MYTIYRLESPSGKQYIGYTAGDVQKRFAEHVRDSTREDYQYRKIARAIKKHNPQDWKIEIIEMHSSREDALAAECALIEEHDTFANGYNMTLGGDGVDSETASQIKQAYWDSERSEKQRKENSDRFKNNNPGDFTGRKHSEESKRKNSNSSSVIEWEVTAPDGSITFMYNLLQFCKSNGLDASNIRRGSSKGWKAKKRGAEAPQ